MQCSRSLDVTALHLDVLHAGQAPTENTAITLLRDKDNLYIGVVAYDSQPERVLGTLMARDANLASDDRIEILLDTFGDQRSAFYFATNPAGALVDGLAFANGQLNTEWDAIWNVRTRRTPLGWVAEFAIPFKSLGFPSGRSEWGFNISRTIYRKLEDARWSGARLQTRFLRVFGSRPDHESRKAVAGHRPRRPPVRRGNLFASRRHRSG